MSELPAGWPIVDSSDTPPAGMPGRCGWCPAKHGEPHAQDCVRVVKRVKVRMVAEYEVEVPWSWDKDQIEFQRNEGSWCSDNAMSELQGYVREHGCICGATSFTYVEDADLTPRKRP